MRRALTLVTKRGMAATKTHYDRVAASYHDAYFYSGAYEAWQLQQVQTRLGLSPEHRLADVGGGTGRFVGLLKDAAGLATPRPPLSVYPFSALMAPLFALGLSDGSDLDGAKASLGLALGSVALAEAHKVAVGAAAALMSWHATASSECCMPAATSGAVDVDLHAVSVRASCSKLSSTALSRMLKAGFAPC